MTIKSVFILFLGLLIVLVGSAVLWSLARRYRRELGMAPGEREKTPDTDFIINAFHDVTKQLKEKEKELERLKSLAEQRAENIESYNQNILQCVTNGVMTFDRNCTVSTINRAAEEMLDLKSEQTIGRSCRDLFDDGDITNTVMETLEIKSPSTRREALLERPAGKIWLGYNTAVLTNAQGEALGIILSFSDLTEVKRLQEQMELRERLIALGEMSAGIAHELRNPMAVISGYLKLLAKKTDPSNQNIIRDISSEINGMNRIIGDLLTFARPASLNRIPVNIKELIEGCVANVLQATGAEGRVSTVTDIEDVTISVDEVLMRQVFTNLLQNAVEAMPGGGELRVSVRVKREEGRVTSVDKSSIVSASGASSHPSSIEILVSDTGAGIPAEQLKKIFLPFFTTKDRGVGLGLAIVHKVILSHGGRIEVDSAEGSGTTFTAFLPMRS
jgi:two-component system sensor histidine kinase AtoS